MAVSICGLKAHADGFDDGVEDLSAYSETIQSEAFDQRSDAKADYFSKCKSAETLFLRPSVLPYVLTTICQKPTEPYHGGGYSKFIFQGEFQATLVKPLSFEREEITTGLAESESEAKAEWSLYCQNWLKKYKASKQKVLVEECGNVATQNLGVDAKGVELWQATSKALRIFDLKTEYQVNPSCYCRQSATFRDYVSTTNGRPSRSYFKQYDLMYLNHQGYFENRGSFDIYEKCVDTVAKTKICQEQ
jgi:hypothetical protein